MAARPILTCEVALGIVLDGGDNCNGIEDDHEVNEVVKRAILEYTEKERRKTLHSTNSTIYLPDINVPNLADLQKKAIQSGYSGRGEMFSTQAMVNLARTHQTGRYNVMLVKRDLLDMTEKVNKEKDEVEPEIIRSEVEKVEDKFIRSAANLNMDGDISELEPDIVPHTKTSDNVNVQPSSSALSVVQRLMRGHLIAVW